MSAKPEMQHNRANNQLFFRTGERFGENAERPQDLSDAAPVI